MMAKYTIELPEIEGFEQVLDEDGNALYREVGEGDHFRVRDNLGKAAKAPHLYSAHEFILKKKPKRFQFGDIVMSNHSGKNYYVYMTDGMLARLIAGNSVAALVFAAKDDLILVEESTQSSREKTIELLNKGDFQ